MAVNPQRTLNVLALFTVQSNVLVGVTSARLALRPVSFDTDAAVDLREVEADLPGRLAIRIQRQHILINLSEPALTFFTITGSNVPSRSRDTSIATWPVAPVSTVLGRVPFRTFPESRTPDMVGSFN